MAGLQDEVGNQYGRLRVVERARIGASGKVSWLCVCDCGQPRVVQASNLRAGRSTSCGCLRAELRAANNKAGAPHGLHGTPAHKSWRAMIERCERPGNASFSRYGAQGVSVCALWRDSFAAFYADMGPRPAGKTLDRIDNGRGYEPGNCRWATPSEQALNRRPRLVSEETRPVASQDRI